MKKIKDEDNFLHKFQSVTKKWEKYISKELGPLGITHTEGKILVLLCQDESISVDSISDQIFIDRSNVGRALKKLEMKGYVIKVRDGSDARLNNFFITKKGEAFRKNIFKLRNNVNDILIKYLSQSDMEILLEAMSKLDEALEDEILKYPFIKNI